MAEASAGSQSPCSYSSSCSTTCRQSRDVGVVMGSLLTRAEPGAQGLVGPRQEAFDGADRPASGGGNLLTRLAVAVLAPQQLADLARQFGQALREPLLHLLVLLDLFQPRRRVGGR